MINENSYNKYFDYFSNNTSYVRTILNMLPEEKASKQDKALIITLYNYILNNLSAEKRRELLYVSTLFNDKVSMHENSETAYKQAEYMYDNFLTKIISDSVNRGKFFDIMNECIKTYVGFYSEYQVVISSPNDIKIEKGHYR